jgi:acyl-[acyl-carrier-protein]-phospholipid O-acyltransferase/long-chain-fatty-acid--[acyl-carrier-protein] ligase
MADSAGKELSFGRTLAGVIALRGLLREELGGDPKEVGVLLPPSIGGALTNLALVLDGRVPVNLNFTMPSSSFASAIEQAGIQTVLTSPKVLEKFPDLKVPGRIIYVEDLLARLTNAKRIWAGIAALFLPRSWILGRRKATAEDPLAILFSSGTTSAPKGIVLTHGNIVSNINAFEEVGRFRKTDRILGTLPFFHSLGLTVTIWMPMTQGVAVGFHSNPLEAGAIGEFSSKFKPTILLGTPSLLLAWARKIPPEAFASARWVIAGAEKLSPRIGEFFENRYGLRPYEGYGATECSPVVSVNVPHCDLDGYCQEGHRTGTVGRPLPNVRVRIVNPDTGEELERGSDGLIEIRGPNVFRGYLGDRSKTDEVMRDGWYRSGDIGHLDQDDFLTLTDRLSRFSKIGGEMISHSLVENALRDALELDPDQVCVTSVPDEKRGERMVVVSTREAGLTTDRLREALRKSDLPNLWKPSPNSWVEVETIPQLGTGKPDLVGIRKLAEDVES